MIIDKAKSVHETYAEWTARLKRHRDTRSIPPLEADGHYMGCPRSKGPSCTCAKTDALD